MRKDNLFHSQILAMQSWGTYRMSEGALETFNVTTLEYETVRSFTLDNIPQCDAMLVFGGYPRILKYASIIAIKHKMMYGDKLEFMTVGSAPNKGQKASKPENKWYEEGMINIGFPESWVMKNHIDAFSIDGKGNMVEIAHIVKKCPELAVLERPKIMVITEAGYSLRAAQELGRKFNDIEFVYFETPLTPVEERTFDVEKFEGYLVDITLASCYHAMHRWDTERLPLPEEKMLHAPSLELIAQYVKAGYAFYFIYPDMYQNIGLDAAIGKELYEKRRIELLGTNLKGEQVAEGKLNCSEIFKQKLFDEMIENICEELLQKGLSPC